MGILAPLLVETSSAERIVLNTGMRGTLKSGLGFLIFGGVLYLMKDAVAPMIDHLGPADPLLMHVPIALIISGILVGCLGLLLLGYRQRIDIRLPAGTLQYRISFFSLPIIEQIWRREDIQSIQARNVTPKRYQSEYNPKNLPVGYWVLELTDAKTNHVTQLDRAPQFAEIDWLRSLLVDNLGSK